MEEATILNDLTGGNGIFNVKKTSKATSISAIADTYSVGSGSALPLSQIEISEAGDITPGISTLLQVDLQLTIGDATTMITGPSDMGFLTVYGQVSSDNPRMNVTLNVPIKEKFKIQLFGFISTTDGTSFRDNLGKQSIPLSITGNGRTQINDQNEKLIGEAELVAAGEGAYTAFLDGKNVVNFVNTDKFRPTYKAPLFFGFNKPVLTRVITTD